MHVTSVVGRGPIRPTALWDEHGETPRAAPRAAHAVTSASAQSGNDASAGGSGGANVEGAPQSAEDLTVFVRGLRHPAWGTLLPLTSLLAAHLTISHRVWPGAAGAIPVGANGATALGDAVLRAAPGRQRP